MVQRTEDDRADVDDGDAAFTPDEFAFFEASVSLTRDDVGGIVLRGLSRKETALYLRYWRAELHGEASPGPRAVFYALHERHLDAVLGDMPRVA